MRDERGCLGGLPSTTRELLGLRAGLDGPPLSRSEAASQLGLSGRTAARIERRGLRELHLACGGSVSGGTVPARLVSLASSAPALQPASYLPMSTAPELKPAKRLDESRGGQSEGTESHPFTGGDGPGPVSAAAATSAALSDDASGGPGPGLIVALCFATLAALGLVALRRRAVTRQRAVTMTPAVATAGAAATEPAEGPIRDDAPDETDGPTTPFAAPPVEARRTETGWTRPSDDRPEAAPLEPSEQAAHRPTARVSRTATVVASSVVSFAIRELARRRKRR